MLSRLLFLLTLPLLASCGRQHDEATALLDRADSLITVNANSAYTLLADVQDEARESISCLLNMGNGKRQKKCLSTTKR